MARTNGVKTDAAQDQTKVADEAVDGAVDDAVDIETIPAEAPKTVADGQGIDDSLNALKALLSAVEKLQKVRQEVGDIKPLLVRMLDGELVAGEDLEQLKMGVGGLSRLVRAYSDHQSALTNAQPARDLIDQVLKPR